MKKIFLFLLTTIISISSFAQNLPQGIAYQAVAVKESPYSVAGENPSAIYWSNKDIKVRFTILDQYPNPTDTYQEFHSVTTDDYGVFNLIIGQGTVISGDFETIPWELGTAHLQVEIDFDNDNNYVVTSFERFWSVPYAKYSQSSEETDPIFNASVAKGISASDTTYWNNKLDSYTETDPVFNTSVAKGITSTDTAYWNNKLDSYTETDPIFNASVAKGITSTDTAYWNNKLDSYTETDPIFNASVAKGITSTDTAYWNNKLDSYTETDPIFNASVAKGITSTDTAYWNGIQDRDSTNELQQISISNDTLFLSNGGFVKLPNSLGQNTSTRLSVKNNYDGAVVTKTGNAGGSLNPTTVTSGSRFINDTVPAGKVYHITYLKLTKSGTRHKSYFKINGQVVCDGDNGSIHDNGPTDLWLGPGDILSYSPGLFQGINGGWSNEWIISYFELPD